MENKTANTEYADPELETLSKLEGNSECFDCGSSPPCFASINNSIYLCANCADEHRSYGVAVSYIRSLFLDKWTNIQIKYIKVGGNKRLNELLDAYELDKNIIDKNFLYGTKLLDFHRSLIKSEVTNTTCPIPPNALEAMSTVIQLKAPDISMNASSSKNEQPQSGGFFSTVGTVFKGAYGKTKEMATNVTEKVKDMDIGTTIKNTGMKTVEVVKTTGSKVKETGSYTVQKLKDAKDVVVVKGTELATKVAESETAQNLKGKAGKGYMYVKESIFGKEEGQTNEEGGEQQGNESGSTSTENVELSNESKK